jgi:hypothetical protein
MEPEVVRTCPRAASWERIEKCLTRLGKATVLRTLPHARVVELTTGPNGAGGGHYLYVERDHQWRLGGLHENNESSTELLAADEVTVSHHHGFRLEIGEIRRTFVSLDEVSAVPGILTMIEVLYCSGDQWRCTPVVRACDMLVRGAAVWSFRGKITTGDNQVEVVGDRSRLSPSCAAVETQALGWSPDG